MIRTSFALIVGLGIATLIAGCGGAGDGGPRQLKLAYVMAPGGPAHEAAEYFAKLVEEKTKGELTVKLYPSAQLGNDRELAEGVTLGSVDMVLGGTAPVGWYFPRYAAIEAPFIFRDYDHLDRVLKGPIGREISAAFAAQRGTLILDWWHRGPRYLTTTSRKVTVLYVITGVSGVDMKEILQYLWPFLIAILLVLLLITYVPSITLFLPNLFA